MIRIEFVWSDILGVKPSLAQSRAPANSKETVKQKIHGNVHGRIQKES
jgi:hypothetical protein